MGTDKKVKTLEDYRRKFYEIVNIYSYDGKPVTREMLINDIIADDLIKMFCFPISLEEEFNIFFADADITSWAKVGDVEEMVMKAISERLESERNESSNDCDHNAG